MIPEHFSLYIESLSFGGKGIGHRADGKVVFVPMVIPGETALIKVEKEHKRHIDAQLLKIEKTSDQRITPSCPLFEDCGGCDWQHIPYDLQLRAKAAILEAELIKHGCVLPEKPSVCPSQNEFGYRCHTRMQCDCTGALKIGFFMKKTNRVIDIESCPIMNPTIQSIQLGIREHLRARPLAGLHSLEIHAPGQDVVVIVRIHGILRESELETVNDLYSELNLAGMAVIQQGPPSIRIHTTGQRFCRYNINVNGREIFLSTGMGGFVQANMAVNASMVNHIYTLAAGSEKILDLYSGSGNIGIPLASAAAVVTAVEIDKDLVARGKINAKNNELDNIRFLNGDSDATLRSIVNSNLEYDTVVLDPPRDGAKGLAVNIARTGAERIIYVSCNPATLARDLRIISASGYEIANLKIFDMFPNTYHIETVCLLRKKTT